MLQPIESQRVGRNLATEQHKEWAEPNQPTLGPHGRVLSSSLSQYFQSASCAPGTLSNIRNLPGLFSVPLPLSWPYMFIFPRIFFL